MQTHSNLGVWRSFLNIGSDDDDPITARIQVAHPYDSDKRTIFMTDADGRDPSNYYREIASGNPTSMEEPMVLSFSSRKWKHQCKNQSVWN